MVDKGLHVIQIQIDDDDYRDLVIQLAAGGPSVEKRVFDLAFVKDKPQVTIQGILDYRGSWLHKAVRDQEQVFLDIAVDNEVPPQAPIGLSGHEATAWRSGWLAGRQK